MVRPQNIRFAVDGMLGRLAKYLRALGYDTLYTSCGGDKVFSLCQREGRYLVTNRQAIPERFDLPVLRPGEGTIETQLRRVFSQLGVVPPREAFLSLCLECNVPTEEVAKEQVVEKLPPAVKASVDEFRRCPSCGRVYWWGSHAEHIQAVIEKSGIYHLGGGSDTS